MTIDYLELLAIGYAIETAPRESNLLIHTDSICSLIAFQKGNSPSFNFRFILEKIDEMVIKRKLSVVVKKIDGKVNPADPASRTTLAQADNKTGKNFWQPSAHPITWPQLMKFQQGSAPKGISSESRVF